MTVKRQGGTELEMVFPAHFLTVSPNGIKHIPPMLDGEVVSYCLSSEHNIAPMKTITIKVPHDLKKFAIGGQELKADHCSIIGSMVWGLGG